MEAPPYSPVPNNDHPLQPCPIPQSTIPSYATSQVGPVAAPQAGTVPPQASPTPQAVAVPQAGTVPQADPIPQASPAPHPQASPYYQTLPISQQGFTNQPLPYYTQMPLAPNPLPGYKKSVRRTIMTIAISLFLFFVINTIVIMVIAIGSLVADGSLAKMMAAAASSNQSNAMLDSDSLLKSFPYGWASIGGIVFGALAFFIVRNKKLVTEDLTRFNERIKAPDLLMMIGLVLGVQAVVSILPFLLELFLELCGIKTPEVPGMFDPYMNLSGVFYVILLGPVVEEIMFRGAVLRALQPYGQNFAIVVSSLLFGVYHLALFQGGFAFFVGLILAYCTLRFSIKWSILLHIMNNTIAMLFMFLEPSLLQELGILLLFLATGILAAVLGFSKFRTQLTLGKPTAVSMIVGQAFNSWGQPVVVRPRPYAYTFSSAWLITGLSIALVIMIFTLGL